MESNMNKKEEMLVITMEECGELIQACSKMLRFGEEQDYTQLQEEIGDVMCMIEILRDGGFVNDKQIADRIKVKKEKLMKWSLLYK
jgi:NTP pyrophosphatase (non-canonical NTP hydrolase)|tara:strand:+ start:2227 stop:2484 length:258 start_codon:yes stop_codon:yes gene_type:complete